MRTQAPVVACVAAMLLGLTSCAVGNVEPSDLSDGVSEIPCDRTDEVKYILQEIDLAEQPGKRNQLKRWGIEPGDDVTLHGVYDALEKKGKSKYCRKERQETRDGPA